MGSSSLYRSLKKHALLLSILVASVYSQSNDTMVSVSITSCKSFVFVWCSRVTDSHTCRRRLLHCMAFQGGLVDTPSKAGGDIVCRILAVDMEGDRSEAGNELDKEMLRCLTDNGMTYLLDNLPRDFVEKNSHLSMGDTYIVIPSGHVVVQENGVASIVYPNSTSIVAIPPTRRHLSVQDRRKGIKSLLVLRVNGADSRNSLSQQVLSQRIFGIGTNAPTVNVRSQFHACSFGKIRIVPATGQGIVDGVASITIGNVKKKDPFNLENQAVAVAEKKLGIADLSSKFDHVMICLPPGTLYGGVRERWYAYGYLNWYRTVFNNEWAGYYSVGAHEIGHNLMLQHSSEGDSSGYGDQSGKLAGAGCDCSDK